jgi:hypothetical protein
MLSIIGNRTLDDEDLPTQDWIHQFENYTQTDQNSLNDSNASKIDTEICLNGWFVNTMPDLNQSNPLY